MSFISSAGFCNASSWRHSVRFVSLLELTFIHRLERKIHSAWKQSSVKRKAWEQPEGEASSTLVWCSVKNISLLYCVDYFTSTRLCTSWQPHFHGTDADSPKTALAMMRFMLLQKSCRFSSLLFLQALHTLCVSTCEGVVHLGDAELNMWVFIHLGSTGFWVNCINIISLELDWI